MDRSALRLRASVLLTLVWAATRVQAQSGDDTSSAPPSSSSSDGDDSSSDGLTYRNSYETYYYGAIGALLIIGALIGAYIWWRKSQQLRIARYGQQTQVLASSMPGWDPNRPRRRYWQGRWREDGPGLEEGLNEQGEAPPPYMHKPPESQGSSTTTTPSTTIAATDVAVPLQTLSRQDVGLKPPDYSQAEARPVDDQPPPPPGSPPRAGSSSHSLR